MWDENHLDEDQEQEEHRDWRGRSTVAFPRNNDALSFWLWHHDVNTLLDTGNTVLHELLKRALLDTSLCAMIDRVLDEGADPWIENSWGQNALNYVTHFDLTTVSIPFLDILARVVDVALETQTWYRDSDYEWMCVLLHLTSWDTMVPLFRVILAKLGHKVTHTFAQSLLFESAHSIPLVQTLLGYGADINGTSIPMVQVLQYGSVIQGTVHDQHTILFCPLHPHTVHQLLQLGADPQHVDAHGQTALVHHIHRSRWGIARQLLVDDLDTVPGFRTLPESSRKRATRINERRIKKRNRRQQRALHTAQHHTIHLPTELCLQIKGACCPLRPPAF
jgi:hypothetical protein